MKFELPKAIDSPEAKLVIMTAVVTVGLNALYDTVAAFRRFFT